MRVSHDLVFTAAEHVQKYIDGHDLSKEFDESVALHTKVCISTMLFISVIFEDTIYNIIMHAILSRVVRI